MQRKLNNQIDKDIKECLNCAANEISASDTMLFSVKSGIRKEESRGIGMKFKFTKMKIAIAAGVLCLATTVTCIAASNGQWLMQSNPKDKVYDFPNKTTVSEKTGFDVDYVKDLGCGFKFESFNTAKQSFEDGDGKQTFNGTSAQFTYKKDGETDKKKHLLLSAENYDKETFEAGLEGFESTMYKNQKIYYSSIIRKDVPEDYVQTEEDKKRVADGSLSINYGVDEVTEYKTQCVAWYKDNVSYILINTDYDDIDKDKMISMAGKVIDK